MASICRSAGALKYRYGACKVCSRDIGNGESFVFGRKENAGKVWHEACGDGSTVVSGVVIPAATKDTLGVEISTVMLSGKVNPKSWPEQVYAFMAAGCKRMLLIGPPGTGKSTIATRVTSDTVTKYRVTCNEDMGREDVVGMFVQKDGETRWQDGAAVRAMREGKRLVMDEIDKASGEVMSLLYALMDDAPSIMLPTGEFVEATNGYEVIATSNGNPTDLPEAILDRVEVVILADAPNPEAYAADTKESASEIINAISVMQNHYRDASRGGWTWKAKPSLRRTKAFIRFRKAGIKDTVVAQAVYGDAGKEVLSAMATASKGGK
jgi:GTPase SAR1 family protein